MATTRIVWWTTGGNGGCDGGDGDGDGDGGE